MKEIFMTYLPAATLGNSKEPSSNVAAPFTYVLSGNASICIVACTTGSLESLSTTFPLTVMFLV